MVESVAKKVLLYNWGEPAQTPLFFLVGAPFRVLNTPLNPTTIKTAG